MHSRYWIAAASLVLFASPLTTPGQTTPYARTTWRSQDGLPENVVQAVVQDRDGYLWVGTTGGITRFDGGQFSPPNEGAMQTLPIKSFYCLLLSRDGTIWAGTDGGGLLHIAPPGVIKVYATPDGLTDLLVHSIYEDSSGRLWVGTLSLIHI